MNARFVHHKIIILYLYLIKLIGASVALTTEVRTSAMLKWELPQRSIR